MSSSAVREHLLAGESILWEGAPKGGLLFSSRDIFLIPFSLVWLGFVCFWLLGVTAAGGPPFFYLFGLGFLVIGLMISIGRFGVDAFVRSRITYAVTTRRVLILRRGPMPDFTAIALNRLPAVKLKQKADGRGTITFGETSSAYARMSIWTPSLDPTPTFLAIADAQRVYNLIQSHADQ